MAQSANSALEIYFPLNAMIALIKPTVNDELDPRPDLAGKSPSW